MTLLFYIGYTVRPAPVASPGDTNLNADILVVQFMYRVFLIFIGMVPLYVPDCYVQERCRLETFCLRRITCALGGHTFPCKCASDYYNV